LQKHIKNTNSFEVLSIHFIYTLTEVTQTYMPKYIHIHTSFFSTCSKEKPWCYVLYQ